MYNQYYPSTPTAYTNPGSPERLKSSAAQTQPQQQLRDEHGQAQGQVYQSLETRPDRPAADEADTVDERKPPAQTGTKSTKRSLEDTHTSPGNIYPPRPSALTHLESSNPQHSSTRSAHGGDHNPTAYAGGQVGTDNEPGGVDKPSREGGNIATGRAPGAPAPAVKDERGDGINEQQLLQDFFQHF